jgi:hypothetical protein
MEEKTMNDDLKVEISIPTWVGKRQRGKLRRSDTSTIYLIISSQALCFTSSYLILTATLGVRIIISISK